MSVAYENTLQSLFKRRGKPGHDLVQMQEVLEKMGNPHFAYPTIHITGTNGKGQTAVKIAKALEESGLCVGLFISPHLIDYRERITVNGTPIPKETLLCYERDLQEKESLNFFECTCCFGFRYFFEQHVDVAVIEVGIGGRSDSTNVIQPLVSVITSVGWDHMDILGNSLDAIASEKAGIIKEKTPVVVGPRAQRQPVFEEAQRKGAPVILVEKVEGFYDLENQAIAAAALQILSSHFALTKEAIEKGLQANLPCRLEKRGNVIYDVAHNPSGFARLSEALHCFYPEKKFRFLIGMNQTKDIRGSLEQIVGQASHIHFVQSSYYESMDKYELASVLESFSSCPHSVEESVERGMERAKAATPTGEILVVCGSFYIMADALYS